jgi:hypothetical protein
MTRDEAVRWLEQQGMKVRVFGESISVGFGEFPKDAEICTYPAIATLHPRDTAWDVVDHGVTVGQYDDFASAVLGLRDYLVARVEPRS